MKVYYHNDLDGRCAAAVVYHNGLVDEFPYELIELDYKNEVPLDIHPGENVFIVDFSFKPEVMEKVLEKTDRVYWFDHHKTSMGYKYSKEIKGVRDIRYSGAELVWRYFNPGVENITVDFVGDRDCWRWELDDTEAFTYGLELYDLHPKAQIWDDLLNPKYSGIFIRKRIEGIIRDGHAVVKFRKRFAEDYLNAFGFETEFEGVKCYALNLYRMGSLAFGSLKEKYDMLIAFAWNGKTWIVSCYSDNGAVDTSVICEKYGGGGHIGASGFTCETLPFKKL